MNPIDPQKNYKKPVDKNATISELEAQIEKAKKDIINGKKAVEDHKDHPPTAKLFYNVEVKGNQDFILNAETRIQELKKIEAEKKNSSTYTTSSSSSNNTTSNGSQGGKKTRKHKRHSKKTMKNKHRRHRK